MNILTHDKSKLGLQVQARGATQVWSCIKTSDHSPELILIFVRSIHAKVLVVFTLCASILHVSDARAAPAGLAPCRHLGSEDGQEDYEHHHRHHDYDHDRDRDDRKKRHHYTQRSATVTRATVVTTTTTARTTAVKVTVPKISSAKLATASAMATNTTTTTPDYSCGGATPTGTTWITLPTAVTTTTATRAGSAILATAMAGQKESANVPITTTSNAGVVSKTVYKGNYAPSKDDVAKFGAADKAKGNSVRMAWNSATLGHTVSHRYCSVWAPADLQFRAVALVDPGPEQLVVLSGVSLAAGTGRRRHERFDAAHDVDPRLGQRHGALRCP
ncbi:hypothetical protein ON010_g12479 [Phytophthora cinnamomi]|nr:hypothetical protein ON010_g12479 [Phytophthora cinnamomi]